LDFLVFKYPISNH